MDNHNFHKDEEYRSSWIVERNRKYLESQNIDISTPHYKDKENYIKIMNERIIGFPGGSMPLDELVVRFMHTNRTFDSIYDMGNPNEIEDDLCTDSAIAYEIWCTLYFDSYEKTEEDILKELERKGGLIERIKKYLGVDLNKLDKDDNRGKRERSKILYFFYMLEHKYYPNTNVLMLLSKPSMESIDNKFWRPETHNGEIVRTIKETLGKELSLNEKGRIYSTIGDISIAWDIILNNARLLLDFLHDCGFEYNSIELIQSPTPVYTGNNRNIHQYPVERLYFVISQREYLGNLLDIDFVNKIQNSNNYDVPPELVEEMRSLAGKPVDLDHVEEYIEENALRLSRYIYLGKSTTKDEVRRIRKSIPKFQKFLNFCTRAKCTVKKQEILEELLIISFFQALILDDQSEVFDYVFYGYQKKYKHMMRVQAALKNDKDVPDALQNYWVRKVIDHWYANVGKYDVRLKFREIEQTCDEIRKQIFSQPTLQEMVALHNFYLGKVNPGFLGIGNQIILKRHVY